MTDRITKHISGMKEYGRKPYLVTAQTVPVGETPDYRYMMESVWHKAQDNEQIVVQSVKKKPYQNSDYETMEYGYDFPIFTLPTWNFKYDFPFNRTRTRVEPVEQKETKQYISGLRWIQTPSFLSASSQYTVIVANSFYAKRTYTNGRLGNNWYESYTPSQLYILPASADAKGISIINVIHKYSTSWFTIRTSADVVGQFYLKATDGRNVIKKKIGTGGLILVLTDESETSTNGHILIFNQYLQYKYKFTNPFSFFVALDMARSTPPTYIDQSDNAKYTLPWYYEQGWDNGTYTKVEAREDYTATIGYYYTGGEVISKIETTVNTVYDPDEEVDKYLPAVIGTSCGMGMGRYYLK
jgi:hypothetical protein